MTKKSDTPAIRFKGFTDTWEQRKVGEVSESYSGGTPSVGVKEYYGGQIPFIRSAEINSEITELFLTEEGLKNSSARLVAVGDILYALYGATSGEVGRARLKGAINQAILAIKPHTDYDSEYLAQWLRKSKHSIIEKYLQGGQGNLSGTIVKELSVDFPSLKEQKAIGDFFRQLDNLITLHQRKYDKLTNVKKSMLEKMFPKNGSNVPEIRFKGFTEAWEQRKLGEVLISLQNNTLSRADLSSEEGIAKNIHYGDILVKFGEVIDVKTESLPMISDETVIAKYKSSFLQNGDVIVADTAEDETVGKCTEIAGLSDEIVISGLHTIPYRPLQKYAPGYLGYYMNSASFHNQLLPLMQGIKVTSISKTALQNTDILYPKSATEQAAIGTYFRNLDNLITLHQRELEKLKNIKKSCLENMFV